MNDLNKRKEAIRLFSSGLSVTQICRILKQSRVWFYKWKKRYQDNSDGEWFVEQSRRPHSVKKKLLGKPNPKSLRFADN